MEIVTGDVEVDLAAGEGEAAAELQQGLLEPVHQCLLFDLALHGGLSEPSQERNFDFYEALEGQIYKLSSRASRGEPADDSDVADVLANLEDRATDDLDSES